MKKIPEKEIKRFIEGLKEDYAVVAPVKIRGKIFFRELGLGDEVCLESNPVNPPKEFFLPQTETLFRFRAENEKIRLDFGAESKKRVLFGVRPCDVHALKILDLVYGGEFKDPYYWRRRRDTILISFTCLEPMEGCFCSSLDTGPSLREGADLLFTDIGGCYLAESFTKAGEGLVESGLFTDATEGDVEQRDKAVEKSIEQMRKLSLGDIPEKMKSLFDGEVWDRLARGCVSCAVCTFLCPTCHCFDVVDEEEAASGEGMRLRCWDTCMNPSFTLQAGGVNPRREKRDRLRHRIYHKFSYLPERYGVSGCVGCGRCIRLCPAGIDVREVLGGIK